jgi:hypothetical protein
VTAWCATVTAALSYPWADNSAACMRIRSRTARRYAVSPPPCAYLVEPTYRDNHRLSATTSRHPLPPPHRPATNPSGLIHMIYTNMLGRQCHNSVVVAVS